jgi:hypothetical protein
MHVMAFSGTTGRLCSTRKRLDSFDMPSSTAKVFAYVYHGIEIG